MDARRSVQRPGGEGAQPRRRPHAPLTPPRPLPLPPLAAINCCKCWDKPDLADAATAAPAGDAAAGTGADAAAGDGAADAVPAAEGDAGKAEEEAKPEDDKKEEDKKEEEEPAPEAPAAVENVTAPEAPIGVYFFATTTVFSAAEEKQLGARVRKALDNGEVLTALETTGGERGCGAVGAGESSGLLRCARSSRSLNAVKFTSGALVAHSLLRSQCSTAGLL